MMIPLPKTIRGNKSLPKQNEYLLNCMNVGDMIISRPACELVTAKVAEPRGSFVFKGVYYAIWGEKLYKDLVLNEVGTIDGVGPVKWAIGFNHAVIVTGTAGANYTVDAASTLTAITDPDVPACSDVTHADGRFLFTPVDGGPALWSEIGDGGDVDTLSFFDAETQPDQNKAIQNVGGDVHILGEDTIEAFRNTGPVTAPFQRVQGATIKVGFVAAKVAATAPNGADSTIFLGKVEKGGYGFYWFFQGTAQLISTPPINELLNQDYEPHELAEVQAQRFNWRGTDCYTFELPDRTLIFHDGKWDYVDSGLAGLLKFGTWGYFNATLFEGIWYVQGANGLCKLSDATDDTAGEFSRQIVTFMRSSEEGTFSLDAMRLAIANGKGAGTVGLAMSKNGRLWTDVFFRDLGALGEHDAQLWWEPVGGLGQFEGYAGIAFYTTDAPDFGVDAMVVQ